MWPTIRDGLSAFFLDPAFFKKTMRSLIMALAAGGVAYADKVAAVIGPGSELAVHKVKIASMLAMGLVLMFGGGDSTMTTLAQNPEAAKKLLGLTPSPASPEEQK
jgi:hypothetical protein